MRRIENPWYYPEALTRVAPSVTDFAMVVGKVPGNTVVIEHDLAGTFEATIVLDADLYTEFIPVDGDGGPRFLHYIKAFLLPEVEDG